MILLIYFFQQKLLIPTFSLALAIGIAGNFMIFSTPIPEGIGYGYIFAGPLAHYFIYDLRYKNEYYFYFNRGLDKVTLYGSTLILNLIIGSSILYNA